MRVLPWGGGDTTTAVLLTRHVGKGDWLIGGLVGSGTMVMWCSASVRLVLDGRSRLLDGGGVVAAA